MPVIESSVVVPVAPDVAFAVSQTTGDLRLRWDPFIGGQHFMDGAQRPDVGVRTFTRHRLGPSMVSEYVSYRPPSNVGMKMVSGPWFFDNFAGGWRFRPADSPDGTPWTRAVWRYSFRIRPPWLSPVADRLGTLVLQREIDRRIAAFARGCADPVVLSAVAAT